MPTHFGMVAKKKRALSLSEGMGRVFERMRGALRLRVFQRRFTTPSSKPRTRTSRTMKSEEPNVCAGFNWLGNVSCKVWLDAGWQIDGTWPMRTEWQTRMRSMASNALASSIVLVCRPRPKDAGVASRRDFLAALKRELPEALRNLQKGNIAPVDLAQAAIGPGMAVFSRYARVLETDGSPMGVRTALSLINQSLDEVLAEQEGEFDADTRWALAWFDQHGFTEGPYGTAETLCTAKNTSVNGMVEAGILAAKGGKVRLLKKEELPADWDPATDERLTIWEATHHLHSSRSTRAKPRRRRVAAEARRDGRSRPRPELPALHRLRAPQVGAGSHRLQRAGALLDRRATIGRRKKDCGAEASRTHLMPQNA